MHTRLQEPLGGRQVGFRGTVVFFLLEVRGSKVQTHPEEF